MARDPYDLTSFSITDAITTPAGYYTPFLARFVDNGVDLVLKY